MGEGAEDISEVLARALEGKGEALDKLGRSDATPVQQRTARRGCATDLRLLVGVWQG